MFLDEVAQQGCRQTQEEDGDAESQLGTLEVPSRFSDDGLDEDAPRVDRSYGNMNPYGGSGDEPAVLCFRLQLSTLLVLGFLQLKICIPTRC